MTVEVRSSCLGAIVALIESPSRPPPPREAGGPSPSSSSAGGPRRARGRTRVLLDELRLAAGDAAPARLARVARCDGARARVVRRRVVHGAAAGSGAVCAGSRGRCALEAGRCVEWQQRRAVEGNEGGAREAGAASDADPFVDLGLAFSLSSTSCCVHNEYTARTMGDRVSRQTGRIHSRRYT